MVKIRWEKHVPSEILEAVDPLLRQWAWLLPTWCHTLYVTNALNPKDLANRADIKITPEYRFAEMTVYPAFLEDEADEREHAVLHEFLHVALDPMGQLTRKLLNRLLGEENIDFRDHLQDQWREAVESSAEDLSHALFSRFGQAPDTRALKPHVTGSDDVD